MTSKPQLPRRFNRKKALARTRLAALLAKLSRASKTGAVPLKTPRLAKRLKICEKTVYRATAMIRGRDLQWLTSHGFVLVSYFDRSIGRKGARRVLAVRASTAARGRVFLQTGATAFGVRKPRHFRSTWGRRLPTGRNAWQPATGALILEIYADLCQSYSQSNGSNGQLSALLKKDMSLTNVNVGLQPANRPSLRSGASKKANTAFGKSRKPSPLAWYVASVCLDVANAKNLCIGATATAVQGWILDGWHRDDILQSWTEATDILKRCKATLRNEGAFLVSMFDRRMCKLAERRPGSKAQRYAAIKALK